MSTVYLTRVRYQRLNAEFRDLIEIRRPQVMADLVQAREYGDLRENAEYETAKRDQGLIEGRIRELEALLSAVAIVEVANPVTRAAIGVCVHVLNLESNRERKYVLVCEQEAHLLDDYLSVESPLGKALLDATVGEVVTYAAPVGTRHVKSWPSTRRKSLWLMSSEQYIECVPNR